MNIPQTTDERYPPEPAAPQPKEAYCKPAAIRLSTKRTQGGNITGPETSTQNLGGLGS